MSDTNSAAQLPSQAHQLLSAVISEACAALGFPTRWKRIISKLERLPPCLSDLSTHPCFARNALCKELLQFVTATLAATHALAAKCSSADSLRSGKLQTQSDLDALSSELDLLLHDCALLVKTGAIAGGALKNLESMPEVCPSPCLLSCPHNKLSARAEGKTRETKEKLFFILSSLCFLPPKKHNLEVGKGSPLYWSGKRCRLRI